MTTKAVYFIVISVAILIAFGSGCGRTGKETEMKDIQKRVGFRHDPMKWVNESETLEGAIARQVLAIPGHENDKSRIQKKVDEILSKSNGDKPIGGLELLALLDLGASIENEDVKKAVQFKKQSVLSSQNATAIDLASLFAAENGSDEQVAKRLSRFISEDTAWTNPYAGCPWWTELNCHALWRCRKLDGMEAAVRKCISNLVASMDNFGHRYATPWGLLQAAGHIDAPEARQMVTRMLPWIAKAQKGSGDWHTIEGTHGTSFGTTVDVLRALYTHGLLDDVLKSPPPEADWEIVRTLSAPGQQPIFLVQDGSSFWTICSKSRKAYQFSIEDGAVITELQLPKDLKTDEYLGVRCFDLWGDEFITTHWDEATVRTYDKKTGKETSRFKVDGMWSVGSAFASEDSLFVSSHDGIFYKILKGVPASEKTKVGTISGGGPYLLSPVENGVWYYGIFTHCLHRSDYSGKCTEWGENPFDEEITGVAYVHDELCVLNGVKGQVAFLRRKGVKAKG